MKQNRKVIIKWLFVIVIIGVIIYTFRDSAGPIMDQLASTKWTLVLTICVCSMLYQLVESLITMYMARQYLPGFSYKHAFMNTFNCSFYRVATLGSGAGVAAVVYLTSHGITGPKALGLYTIEYALHKISIAILSGLFFLLNWKFMMNYFQDYTGLLVSGYVITIIITSVLLLFSVSKRFHGILLWITRLCNKKHKWDAFYEKLKVQCEILEVSASELLSQKLFVLSLVGLNLIKLSCWYAIPYFVLRSTGVMNLSQCIALTSLGVLLAAVIPSPAGIGSSEFVLISLFTVLVGTASAGALSLLYRFATFVFPFLVGVIIVVIRKSYYIYKIRD